MIERSRGRFNSPVRLKNKKLERSPSPSCQSISSIRTISTSTPTHHTLSRLHRRKLANVFDFDKPELSSGVDVGSPKNISVIENICHRSYNTVYDRNLANQTISGAYSIPYREKRNPLNHTRLSCYKPAVNDQKFRDIQNQLKNYKSVDDFLSLNNESQINLKIEDIEICKNNNNNNNIDMEVKDDGNMDENDGFQKNKRRGFSSKFRSMSDKTQKLFSKFYSNPNHKSSSSSSSEICNDFKMIQPSKQSTHVLNNRRSMSYGTLADIDGLKEFNVKKIETEDGDSGIIINESGASSMIETDNDDKNVANSLPLQCENVTENENQEINDKVNRKFIQR